MATKPTLPTLTNTGNVQAQLTTINQAYRDIEDEFEKMLSREAGSLPNSMADDLDMDSNKVINVADGVSGPDAVNKSQLDTKEDLLGTPAADGYILASMMDGTRFWVKASSVGSGGATLWGAIGGSLADQIDLTSALATKLGIGDAASAVDNLNSLNSLKFWTGSQVQYDALTPDSHTLYFII
jgi:hypothetical protein